MDTSLAGALLNGLLLSAYDLMSANDCCDYWLATRVTWLALTKGVTEKNRFDYLVRISLFSRVTRSV
jgi:hypothetical protein